MRSHAVRLVGGDEENVGGATGRCLAWSQAAHRRRCRPGRTPLNGYHALIAFVMALPPAVSSASIDLTKAKRISPMGLAKTPIIDSAYIDRQVIR